MKRSVLTLCLVILPTFAFAEIWGSWTLIPHKSTEIDLFNALQIDIQNNTDGIRWIRTWGRGRSVADTVTLPLNGRPIESAITHRAFASNVFMGLSLPVGEMRSFSGEWIVPQKTIRIHERLPVQASQGEQMIEIEHRLNLAENGETLSYELERSTRKSNPLRFVCKRTGTAEAFVMELEDDWRVDGKLDHQAFLIGLQGLANANGANLYFLFPESWDFNYTPAVYDFYRQDRFYNFRKLTSLAQALKTFRDKVKGYVVWDKEVRTSLIVAFTIAGLEKAVIVSEEMIPLVRAAGLEPVENLVGRFTGMSDVKIYQWAYDRYWQRCNKTLLIWMGGEHGNIMKPGIADWGIRQGAFFQDLSTRPEDGEEYALSCRLLGELEPMSMIMGWHSYKKDKERDHVRLTSSYGHRVKGLHTLPNTSFSAQVPMTPGFEFKNQHRADWNKAQKPQKKVYLTCVQTDGVGLGAWTKPGRGEIPYAWCLGLNDLWLGPAMLEFFYRQATPNDYFIGGTTPGYMYPKMIPDSLRPDLMGMAQSMLDSLDLCITQTMDYSEGATVEGNTELTEQVIDAFYTYLPKIRGFCNGYAPAYTFAVRNKIPVVSYDYYLSPSRPIDDAVADLIELAEINSARPYFLLAHIRQWSDIRRVKTILDHLPEQFEIVPLDVFMQMAGEQPTFQERMLVR
ncbi:hypothetical protein JW992_15420 [candidate division KSB1 bacterium]|nr:hypothetical protein [candidate division KSB1 bacterium]